MLTRALPVSFVERKRLLSWREVHVGLREDWLTPASAIDLAIRRFQQGHEDPGVLELAGLLPDDGAEARAIVGRLAERDTERDEQAARLTWLRLLLAWVFQNRGDFSDPLGIVEELYADFGHPNEIRHLVRYNESSETTESREEALAVLLARWEKYLDETDV